MNLSKSVHVKRTKIGNFIHIRVLLISTDLKYRSNFLFGDIDNYQFLIYLIFAPSLYREIAYSDCITVGRQGYVKNTHIS